MTSRRNRTCRSVSTSLAGRLKRLDRPAGLTSAILYPRLGRGSLRLGGAPESGCHHEDHAGYRSWHGPHAHLRERRVALPPPMFTTTWETDLGGSEWEVWNDVLGCSVRWLAVGALAVGWVGAAATAEAHLELQSPPSRYDATEQKNGPCGRAGGTRGTDVTVFRPGERIEVVWEETVNHPAHYRIAFDIDGDDDFIDPPCETHCDDRNDPEPPTFTAYADPTVLLDTIEDGNRAVGRAQVTLPDVECENCTLQVIQVMYDKRPITTPGNDIYYACADIALRRTASGGDDGGATNDGGTSSTDAGQPATGETDGGGSSTGPVDAGTPTDPVPALRGRSVEAARSPRAGPPGHGSCP